MKRTILIATLVISLMTTFAFTGKKPVSRECGDTYHPHYNRKTGILLCYPGNTCSVSCYFGIVKTQ